MTYTLKTADQEREFWCADDGGYVYEIDDTHPGTMGRQVSDSLSYTGNMLWATASTLQSAIQRARRRERREERY